MATKQKGVKRKSKRDTGVVKDIHKFVKDNKLISKGLALLPIPGATYAAGAANLLGYGKKKKRIPRRGPPLGVKSTKTRRVAVTVPVASRLAGTHVVQHGAGFFSDLGGGIGNVFGGLGGGIGSIARGMFGGGSSRNVIRTTL